MSLLLINSMYFRYVNKYLKYVNLTLDQTFFSANSLLCMTNNQFCCAIIFIYFMFYIMFFL